MSKDTVAGGGTLNPAPETPPRRKGAPIAPEVMAAALDAYRAGGSATDIALQFGFSRNHLYERAARAGIRKVVRVAPGAPALEPFAEPPQKVEIAFHPVRFAHPRDTWLAVRRDYLAGYSAQACEERYGVKEATLRDRAAREGWRRKDRKVRKVEPLHPEPDPAQVQETPEGAAVSKWDAIAHEAQRPPAALPSGAAWATWLLQGGRGAGKTRAGAEWLAARAEASPRARFALVGATLHDVREVMIDGPSGLRNLPGRVRPVYEVSRRRLVWPNQAEAYAFSAEEPERLRGPQFEAAWADEFCAWPRGEYTLMLLRMGLRLGADPRLVVTTTPKPQPALRKLRAERTCVTTQAPTHINAAHLTPTFLAGLEALYGGTRFAAQELEGVLLDGEGALWRAQDLAAARGAAPAALDRVVVAVDPPAGSEGAACGIVVAGRLHDRAYVLADRTVRGESPLGWARAVVAAARDHGAVEIIAEANQGGDMVRAVLALAGAPCALRLVHATRGKRARAEPVAALYEQGRVIHAGAFAALEEEMMALGADGAGPLDRADALVWALTVLLLEGRAEPRVLQL